MAKDAAGDCWFQIQHAGLFFAVFEEFIEDLVGVVSIPIASQKLSTFEQTFLQLFQAVFIVKGAFDGVTEYLICFS
jgi:hypothetical protein